MRPRVRAFKKKGAEQKKGRRRSHWFFLSSDRRFRRNPFSTADVLPEGKSILYVEKWSENELDCVMLVWQNIENGCMFRVLCRWGPIFPFRWSLRTQQLCTTSLDMLGSLSISRRSSVTRHGSYSRMIQILGQPWTTETLVRYLPISKVLSRP